MCQPLKQVAQTASSAWSPVESHPNILALGSSALSGAGILSGDDTADARLDFCSLDLGRQGNDMEVVASVRTDGNRRFTTMSWGSFGVDTGVHPMGVLAGGLQGGIVNLWDPHQIIQSKGANPGLLYSNAIHGESVHSVECHPTKPNLLATAGADGEVNILNIEKPSQPDLYKPSSTASKHAGSEVLCVAWNRKVAHILCSASNTGQTVVWDLKRKAEVISFKDPASRQRCSVVAWHPEVPMQLLVAYDDDRNPSMQMWDLRNVSYPFKETAGHSKGILDVAWNDMDPNLLLSCGKDNRTLCWCLSSGTPEMFCEVTSQQQNFEVSWAPHMPAMLSASSFNGVVGVHSMQQSQSKEVKYCPRWYKKPCGASFGFGGKVLAYGAKPKAAEGEQPKPPGSWCQALVVPNEPELVPTADMFERWIAERKLREYCHERVVQTQQGADNHDHLMWNLMALQFEADGRQQLPALLGYDSQHILQEAERYLGHKPGATLTEAAPEPPQAQPQKAATPAMAPQLDLAQCENFFEELSVATQQKEKEDAEREAAKQMAEAWGAASAGDSTDKDVTDWSRGPESLVKKSLLIGDLPAAVEVCLKSGRMADALLLASGGGTDLWVRTRDEYLRLQGDPFLKCVGNIMTQEFDALVASADLSKWMETLAVLATYSGTHYQRLCAQLGSRLETEKFDIRSAVVCYICAGDFPKTVSIWTNTHVASQGSQKLALQGLVEKMTVLQDATKFNQADPLFNNKLTQYAEILANSGRVTAAMRYLCLLRDDASSMILRDRIYNSAPHQMAAFGRAPSFPFETTDVRITHVPAPSPQPQTAYGGHPGAGQQVQGAGQQMPGRPGAVGQPMPGSGQPMPGRPGAGQPMPNPGQPMPGRPGGYPTPGMPATPAMPSAPAAAGGYPTPGGQMPAAPRMNMPGTAPAAGYGAAPQPGMHQHGMQQHGMQQQPVQQQPAGGHGLAGMPAPRVGGPTTPMAAPTAGPGVMPPHQAAAPVPQYQNAYAAPAPAVAVPQTGGATSTAPNATAKPTVEGLPVAWPLPTKTQQKLSTTTTVAAGNMAVQEACVGGGATAVLGEPMPAHEVTYVRNVLTMLLEASAAQDGNPRKREANAKSLEELYAKLASGNIKPASASNVVNLVKAVEGQDFATANRIQVELSTSDWDQNKTWLMGVKRILPAR